MCICRVEHVCTCVSCVLSKNKSSEGAVWLCSGQKAMAVRFQAPPQPGRPLLDSQLRHFSMPPLMQGQSHMHSLSALNSLSVPQFPLGSVRGRSLPSPAPAPRQYSLPALPGNPNMQSLFSHRPADLPGFSQPGKYSTT